MALDFVLASSEYLEWASTQGIPFSVSCLFKTTDVTGFEALFCIADTAGDANRNQLQLFGDKLSVVTRQTTNATASTTAAFSADVWNHACGVFESSTSRSVYLNGGNKVTNTTSKLAAGLDMAAVGRISSGTPSTYLNGSIAELAVWNVALSDDDVAALAKGVSPMRIRAASLLHYLPLVRDIVDRKGGVTITTGGTPDVVPHPPIGYGVAPYVMS